MRYIGENSKQAASAIRTVFRSGVRTALMAFFRKLREKRNYRKWVEKFGVIDALQRQQCRDKIDTFENKPLVSILLPVYNVDERWLRLCIESVFKQIYINWELCISDDHSTKPHVRRVLEEYAAKDERIKVVFRETNGHISAASNSALNLVTGEFTVLLDHDDELSEDALFWVACELENFPETMMIYSDEDLINEKGRRFDPKFKPDWSRDLFYSVNIITHLSAYRTSLLRDCGGFRLGFEGSQDYDLALRVIEKISERKIRHIPRILYHWRVIRGSVAYGVGEKPYAHERAREALRSHFERIGKTVTVTETANDLHRVRYQLPEKLPKVSLILISDEAAIRLKRAAEYSRLTQYPNFEIVLIAKKEPVDEPDACLNNVKLIINPKAHNAEALNLAAAQSDGEILCFADANLTPQSSDWLTELVSLAFQEEIGAVGAKVLSKNETVSGTGIIIGASGIAGVAHKGFPRNSPGNMSRNRLVGNYSAVSVSCLAVRRKLFNQFEGFDSENLPNNFFDADFCLRLGEKGFRIVFTPNAELIQFSAEKRSNHPTASEREYFHKRWNGIIARDQFYNPNLSKKDASFSIDV
jgi:O-antigen biosynthesis protein